MLFTWVIYPFVSDLPPAHSPTMAADPKNTGLLGITVDQPDMYETVEGGEMEEQEDSSTSTEEGETLHLTSLSWQGYM